MDRYSSSYSGADSADPQWARQQLHEAILAGRRALASLNDAKENISSAKKWGLFDMLGGGFIVSAIKHDRMEKAAGNMRQAQSDLERFQRELLDVRLSRDLALDTNGFLSFADFFFDGFAADFLVQRKISKAAEQIDRAISEVSSILGALEDAYRRL